ncbi:MAG: 3-dehydroquinate synthase [Oscillospiraceae bacterium]|nr:3-dehydroquinate synthase [Oscillospiraceae bacterium]MBO5917309.1 3-dehydroquinate synthase [Oscillospiraceae bacterium]
MKALTVALPGREYDIKIETGLLDKAGACCRAVLPKAKRVAVVTDSNVAPLYLQRVYNSLKLAGFAVEGIVVPAGESSKSMEMLGQLYDQMLAFGLSRTDAVVALGGGVVGDLAGFAAATVLRGVDYVQIPTTLLAQVDSSVGGKVAIDLPAGKNLAGAFWQPKLVLMDPACLTTLSERIFSDGMAEVIKYGCIRDADFFRLLLDCGGRAGVMEHIEQVLYTCCDMKRRVVLNDERDTGERMVLNFGHTVGHAFELAGHYETWTHGQAVAVGMLWAAALGERLGVTPAGTGADIRRALEMYHLPAEIPCEWETMVEAVGLDKKRAGEGISFVLLEQLGCAVPVKMDTNRLLDELKQLYEG